MFEIFEKKSGIFKIQKRALRNIVGAKNMDFCKPHFKNLEMLIVYSICMLESEIFVKK